MKARAASTRAGKVSKRLLNNTFMMAEAVEHVCDNHGYNRMEKKFVESLYDSRVFQKAKDSGKVLCPDCNVSQGNIQFFTASGIEFHYRRVHKGGSSIMTRL